MALTRVAAMDAPRPTGDRLAVVYGYSLPEAAHPVEGERVSVDGGGRPVEAIDAEEIVALPRHGFDRGVPAHLVDHRANIRALCELGCGRVLSLGSVGSLRRELAVGSFVCPDDFYAPETAPSFYDDPRGHSVPGFDPDWRAVILAAWRDRTDTDLIDGGVYAHTVGPRREDVAVGGPHEQLVAEGAAQPLQHATHRRLTQADTADCPRHLFLLEQGDERREEIQIHVLNMHCAHGA